MKPVSFLGNTQDVPMPFMCCTRFRRNQRQHRSAISIWLLNDSTVDVEISEMRPRLYKNAWGAIEISPADAANMKARSDVLNAIRTAVDKWEVTQAAAAKRLGITQPRLNDLLRGKINKFSVDALMNIASNAGLSVRVKVVQSAA